MSGIPLENLCTMLTDGTHYTPPDAGEGVPFLTVADMQPNGLNFSSCSRITSGHFLEAKRQNSAPIPGDVLFSKDGTVGKVHVVNGEGPFAVLSSIAIIRPDPTKLDSGYLSHFLRTPSAISAADRSKTGSALRRIILKDIRRLKIHTPELREQQRIAAILDQADELRHLHRERGRSISLLARTIFRQHQREINLPPVSLREACNKITDGTHQSPTWADDGIPFIFVSNIRNQRISLNTQKFVSEATYASLTKHSPIEEGDVLYTCVGSYGHAALVPSGKEFIFQRHVAHLKPNRDRLLPGYLVYLLESEDVRKQADARATGIAQKTVTLGMIKDFKVRLPEIAVQREVMKKIDQLKALESESYMAEYRSSILFGSLQQRAFRGEL